MSELFKKFARAFMPNIIEAGMRTFLDDIRRKASSGEIDPEWLLAIANMLRGIADELEELAGGGDLMAKVRRKAKRVDIKEE